MLRLRVRTIAHIPTSQEASPPGIPTPERRTSLEPSDSKNSAAVAVPDGLISWQPSTSSSSNPSLSPRVYSAYIYDACFDHKYHNEKHLIQPIDIHPRTSNPISLGSGLTTILERNNQPPRSGCIFPLFHVIQEAWDFILGEEATLMPIYPPIASEAWLQIRLVTGIVPGRYREHPAIHIEPSRDPLWPFRFDEYSRFSNEEGNANGRHQFALVSRLSRPNLVQDEGILLVSVRDTQVSEWIQDERYREIMTSMINVADVGGPQEFILGGAVISLQDFERFIPRGMVNWFRRRILQKWTRTNSPQSERRDNSSDHSGSSTGSEEESSAAMGPGDVVSRLIRAMQVLPQEGDESDEDIPEAPTPGPPIPETPGPW